MYRHYIINLFFVHVHLDTDLYSVSGYATSKRFPPSSGINVNMMPFRMGEKDT